MDGCHRSIFDGLAREVIVVRRGARLRSGRIAGATRGSHTIHRTDGIDG